MAKREPQEVQLLGCGREQKIGLVTVGVASDMKFRAYVADFALNIMARGHAIGIQFLGGLQQVFEFDAFVAPDAGHWCSTRQVTVGKFVDDGITEDVLVVEDIMRKSHVFGHTAGIVDVQPGAARAFFGKGRPVIIELKRDAHDIIALLGQLGGDNRTVHAAGHGHHHAGFRGWFR